MQFLWGDLSPEETKKFSLLALGFFFIIGSWWPLKVLKDSIFINMVGSAYQPDAKIASLILFFPLVLLYSFLVDYIAKERLIYILTLTYGIIGLIFVYFMMDPVIGISNTSVNPSRIFPWLFYLFAESYISLMLAVYWSFTNDITLPGEAEKGYGLIIFGNQFGGFLATLIANYVSQDTEHFAYQAPYIALCSVLTIFLIGFVVFILKKSISGMAYKGYTDRIEEQLPAPEEQVGFLDGLRALFTTPYITGIFGIIFFQEVISTIMSYQMFRLVETTFNDSGMRNKFLFDFALSVQIIAALFALFGTSFVQRRFGITFSLVSYPALLACLMFIYWYSPSLNSIFYALLLAKALNYALNQPAKEVLYIPTSRNIKFKSKAWIDMFGLRFAKAIGSHINRTIGRFVVYVGGFSLSIIGLWICMASMLGAAYKKAVKNKEYFE